MSYIRVYKGVGIYEDIQSEADLYKYDLSGVTGAYPNPLDSLLSLIDYKDGTFCSFVDRDGLELIFIYWPNRNYFVKSIKDYLKYYNRVYLFIVEDIQWSIRREVIGQINFGR